MAPSRRLPRRSPLPLPLSLPHPLPQGPRATGTARSLAVAAVALALAGGALAAPGPAGASAKPKGHDVSSHQGTVNWVRAKANGARFVYVKATEGTHYKNPYFARQFRGARKAGILHGTYHFARADKSSGKRQAAYFTANGGTWKRDGWTLPPAVDLEAAYGSRCHGLSKARMRAWIRAFSEETRRRTGRYPAIYTSTRWWKSCTGNSRAFAARHPLWLADWSRSAGPLPAGWGTRTIWQYANKGKLPGDQNLFNGSMAQLRRYARG
ncbi:lysozyme [Streptomyces sp. NPDC054796]